MIDLAAASHGVLSKKSLEHLQDIRPADRPSLDQTDHHPRIVDEMPRRRLESNLLTRRWSW
jgi:hypothetical protein